jgi:NAD-dependent deacetylase sirtuin 5
MASSATKPPIVPQQDLESFQEHLNKSTRILALLGAGLSASSGLPTFRGAGGLWRTHDAVELATPEAFQANPGLVWQFYSYRRHMALKAKPNAAHYALAALARKNKNFLTLSQNVDGTFVHAVHSQATQLTVKRSLPTSPPSRRTAQTPPRLPL